MSENMEILCAKRAVEIVKTNGGAVTFEKYDEEYRKLPCAFVPFHWGIVGHAHGPSAQKKNQGVLSARKAVELGLLKHDAKGYALPESVSQPDMLKIERLREISKDYDARQEEMTGAEYDEMRQQVSFIIWRQGGLGVLFDYIERLEKAAGVGGEQLRKAEGIK